MTAARPLVVDVRGAMKMLSLGRTSVLELADAGELPRVRFGRAVRFSIDDIERLVKRRRSGEQLLTGAREGCTAE